MRGDDEHVMEQVQGLAGAFVAVERDFAFRHGDVDLHASEIHLMKAVAFNPGSNAKSLAQRLGVTKGAVSQTMARLEKKDVIRKESGSGNNEIRVLLTPAGSDALEAFERQTAAQWRSFSDYVASLSEEERRVIIGFVGKLRGFLRELS